MRTDESNCGPRATRLAQPAALAPGGPVLQAVGAQQDPAAQVGRLAQAGGEGQGHSGSVSRGGLQGQNLDAAPGAVAKADGGVQQFGGEVDLVVVGLQAQLDVG